MGLEISELKVYVPAKDFEMSKAFYRELGFELTEGWGGTFDCRLGPVVFRLQNYYVKDWANNFMLQFEVADARAWYDHARRVLAAGNFADARVSPPEEIGGAVVTHLIDPSGVLLIFIA